MKRRYSVLLFVFALGLYLYASHQDHAERHRSYVVDSEGYQSPVKVRGYEATSSNVTRNNSYASR